MELWKIESIFNKFNRFISLNELYDEFFNRYDVSKYVDFRAAIRTEIYRNCVDRDLNTNGKKVFVSLKMKGEKGQEYGLYEWVKQDSVEETKELLENMQKFPAIYTAKSVTRVVRNEVIKKRVLKRAEYSCEFDVKHKTFARKTDGNNYTEVHHLIPLELQLIDKYQNVNLDCMANMVSLCSNCHNQIHYGKEFEGILRKLYFIKEKELKEIGINISFEELLSYYK